MGAATGLMDDILLCFNLHIFVRMPAWSWLVLDHARPRSASVVGQSELAALMALLLLFMLVKTVGVWAGHVHCLVHVAASWR